MMQLYPAHAAEALEFHKIQQLLAAKCRTDTARKFVAEIRFHTRIDYVKRVLEETREYHSILGSSDYFPNDFTQNIQHELRILAVSGGVLQGEQLLYFSRLVHNTREILRWFKRHQGLYPALWAIAEHTEYFPEIATIIDTVVDNTGQVKDAASKTLLQLRNELGSRRQELRKIFDQVLRKLNKQGYLADISEGFLNGRRTVAIQAEHKRVVKGILHGETDSQRIVFIEPEETIFLNNQIASLEQSERKEVLRILAETTAKLSEWHPQLEQYYYLSGAFDFIRARALLAADMDGKMPSLSPHPGVRLVQAYHPLLLLQHQKSGKQTLPLKVTLDREQRILIISGPNAGGKTVSMKTVGLLQLMVQAGLLVPVSEQSEFGIFKQLMIHIGDTQSIEHELSTYSAHLRDMKYFMEFANGKTLFFIDELGSGSDPGLGGAFAEAIVEHLSAKKAFGVITTHYLNLKVMAGKVPGIVNGAMSFDEEQLEPLYQLVVGKPGSSYTFAIAQRTGLPEQIINRARKLADGRHFQLDRLLHETEQQSLRLTSKEKQAETLLRENEKLRKKYEVLIDKERVKQEQQTIRLQNQIKREELEYLRDMERKFRQIIKDWKTAEDKQQVIAAAEKVLFKKKQIQANAAMAKKADKQYRLVGREPQVGDLVRHKTNHQVGRLTELKDRRAVVLIGKMPFSVQIDEWMVVQKKAEAD